MASKRGAPNDRKVVLNKPWTATSTKTVKSNKTRTTAVSEQPTQKQTLKLVTKRELVALVSDLEKLKRENDWLLQKQEAKFGVTVDNAGTLKQELAKAKAINSSLLEEIELGKAKCDRLYEDFVELQTKFETCEQKLKQYRRGKKQWDDTRERLRIADDRCRRLIITNKNLKSLLLKNHINPGTAWLDTGQKPVQNKLVKSPNFVRKLYDIRKKSPKTMKWI